MLQEREFQGQQVWEVVNGPGRLLVAPQFGARLLSWDYKGLPVIPWPDGADWSRPAGVRGGNPILFPFVARHMVDGQLGLWRDEQGVVRPMPMHGFARDQPFEVLPNDDVSSLRMRLQASPATHDCYPFDFSFEVTYTLSNDQLMARFTITNRGDRRLPYYPGHHFYFQVPHLARSEWQVTIPCRRWARQRPDGSIAFEPCAMATQPLSDPGLVDRFHIDLTGEPVILERTDGSRRLTIAMQQEESVAWYDVTTWTERTESDFFCVEPWLGLPNAIHHGHGLLWLHPAESATAVCRVQLDRWTAD